NNRAQLPFSVAPLFPPTIEHVPPASLELGEVYNLTCRLQAPSTIAVAFVDYGDEDGIRHELPLSEGPVSGDFFVHLPAPQSTGQVNYKINVKAGNGAWNITNPYYIPVLDTTPPTIEHTPPWTHLPVLSAFELNATVTDLGSIEVVRLLYTEPSTGFHGVMCGRQGDKWFYPIVLGPVSGTMEYSWQATDTWGNSANSTTFMIAIEDEGPPLIEPVPSDPIELGDDMVLEAKVTDDSLLDEVWVTYKRPGETEEVNGTPAAADDRYRLTVLNLTSPGTLTYSWWAMDVNGHTTTSGDLEVAVVDTVPPEISDIAWGDAIAGLEPWVQAEVTDVGGLASVVVEYIDVFGTGQTVEMDEILPDIFQASLTAQTTGGVMTFQIIAHDPSENSARSGERSMVVRDVESPEIVHVPPQDLLEGQEVTFEVEVTDNVGVAEVWLYLRVTASASHRRLAMENVGDDLFAYTLAEGELSQPHVLYYFEAEDLPPSSNMATDPLGAPQVSYLLNVTGREMTLSGIVKASGGDPIEGATVNLVGHDTVVETGANGSYEIPGLVAGSYIIEVRADGFEPFTTTVLLVAQTGDRKLDVTLVPRSTGGGEDEELPWMMIAALGIFAVIALLVLIMTRSSA
ncbi:MAG: carboxypeptidase regulatory-like domain-containing protein, partial [Thermoplasmata archaeon]|nr:carboxypeptidase regulatory-like domain-containing protein [Thermoplasmata archaeon]